MILHKARRSHSPCSLPPCLSLRGNTSSHYLLPVRSPRCGFSACYLQKQIPNPKHCCRKQAWVKHSCIGSPPDNQPEQGHSTMDLRYLQPHQYQDLSYYPHVTPSELKARH